MNIQEIIILLEQGIQARKLADFIQSDPYQQGYGKALQDIKTLLEQAEDK